MIRHIAKSVPVGYRILAKEHPIQYSREWRSTHEYNEIMNIPNVTLIHGSFSDKKLLQNCSLVLSIAGSSGLEAAFYGKPSVVFANVIYSYLPSVTKVDSIENLSTIIRKSLITKPNLHDVTKFMKILSENLIDFDQNKFFAEFQARFTLNGAYIDSKINEHEMEIFLNEKKHTLEILCNAHIDKIKQHKAYLTNSYK